MGLNLLDKKEVWINEITLTGVNLSMLSDTVADILGVKRENMLVVDVRPSHITLDILEEDIPEENIIGKEKEILEALSHMEGVTVTDKTYIHSNGILGMICYEEGNSKEFMDSVNKMTDEIKKNISKRVLIFPTGFEVRDSMIEDTNTPYLKAIFEKAGYKVSVGKILEDDVDVIAYHIQDALSRGYGLIITTGGVGAEDKDKTVEGILQVDPTAAAPYIVKFHKGTGRHVKDGVRIAVGRIGLSFIAALPGPNDEVKIGAEILLQSMQEGDDKKVMAEKLAEALAKKLMSKKIQHKH